MAALVANSIKSTTVEGAFFELAAMLQTLETDKAKNAENLNYVSFTISGDGSSVSISANLPIEMAIDTSGKFTAQAKPYLL
jgi:hypothetical protein